MKYPKFSELEMEFMRDVIGHISFDQLREFMAPHVSHEKIQKYSTTVIDGMPINHAIYRKLRG